MKKSFIFPFATFLLFSFIWYQDGLFYAPEYFPKPIYNFKNNPLKQQTIDLGRALFYDPILSKTNTISCVSCHSPYVAFTHVDHDLSHGIFDSIGTRNSPALMNLAWQKSFMWDGAITNLDMQSLAPISHPLEMGSSIDSVVFRLKNTKIYPRLFSLAFGDSTITGERTLKAIAQFMVTLVSANSKYDKVKRKEMSFSEQEEKGYLLFLRFCNSCHTEPLFTNGDFANNGLSMDPQLKDIGRARISQNPLDSFKFKIPTLRNIEFSFPYMHDGRYKRLGEILKHYSSGILKGTTLAPELRNGIPLSSDQRVDLTAFLLTLSDKDFLFEPKFSYPKEIYSK
jgi:cytochrome c peroxidase